MPVAPINLQLAGGPGLPFPLQGVNDAWARSAQPAGTTPDCLNVMPYDLTKRGRGGIRPGFAKTFATSLGGATAAPVVQGVVQCDHEDGSGNRTSYLVVFAGGHAYVGTDLTGVTVCTGSTFAAGVPIYSAPLLGFVYFGDGTSSFRLSCPSAVVATWTAGFGVTVPPKFRLACTYRSRVVVAQTADGNPQNFYASAIGDPLDWNFGASGPGAAFAGNDSRAGQIGEPITALMPLGDDALVFGCDHSLWLMSGDIAAGGRIDLLNGGIGAMGQGAWCLDPRGNLYMVGTGGFYKMARGSLAIENLSLDKYNSAFAGVPRSQYTTSVAWDRDRHGCWIFRYAAGASSHLWWDARTGGFFPLALPALLAPTCALVYDGATAAAPRRLVAGGIGAGTGDAHVYSPSDAALTDDGTAISSYAYFGPIRPAGVNQESKLEATSFVLGETPPGLTDPDFAVNWQVQCGKTPGQALLAPTATQSGAFAAPGRQPLQRARLKGSAFFAKLTGVASKTWSVDEVAPRLVAAGRVR